MGIGFRGLAHRAVTGGKKPTPLWARNIGEVAYETGSNVVEALPRDLKQLKTGATATVSSEDVNMDISPAKGLKSVGQIATNLVERVKF